MNNRIFVALLLSIFVMGLFETPAGSQVVSGLSQITVTSISSALPAGTNAIGKLAANAGVNIGTVDIGTFPANQSMNVAQFGGNAVVTGIGISGTGIPRVTVSSDSVISTKNALTANAPTFATVGVASGAALAANTSRKGATFVNTSSNTISCAIGAAAVLNSGITMLAGGAWTMNEYTLATGAVNCIAGAASSNLSIQEFQ